MNLFTQIGYSVAVLAAAMTLTAWMESLIRRRQMRKAHDEKDWGLAMQKAAEAHLDKVNEALWIEEDGGADVDSPAAGPYCGCSTCVVREVLAGAWPVISDFVVANSKRRHVDLHLRAGAHADD